MKLCCCPVILSVLVSSVAQALGEGRARRAHPIRGQSLRSETRPVGVETTRRGTAPTTTISWFCACACLSHLLLPTPLVCSIESMWVFTLTAGRAHLHRAFPVLTTGCGVSCRWHDIRKSAHHRIKGIIAH